jgi:hypothetical protein
VREFYMKALQWETNNAHRVESHKAEFNQPKARVFTHVKGDSRDKKKFYERRDSRESKAGGRDSFAKRKSSFAGGSRKRPRTDEGRRERHKIEQSLYDARVKEGRCFKCGLEGHRASV